MDIITYALLNKKVQNLSGIVESLPPAFDYKGAVASTEDLPNDAASGDAYSVNTELYFFNGTEWKRYISDPSAITNAQIDALFTA